MIPGPLLPRRVNYTGIGYFPKPDHPFICDVCGLPGRGPATQTTHKTQPCRGIKDQRLRARHAELQRKRRRARAILHASSPV